MEIKEQIKNLREETRLNRKDFAEHFGIPLRTVEDWEAGRRTPPAYLPRLMFYQIKYENHLKENEKKKKLVKEKSDRNIEIVHDVDGNSIVVIHDIKFKGKRRINWKDVEDYLQEYIGEFYEIAETGDIVYIGKDLPEEYTWSKSTKELKGTNAKAKANATQGLPELIQIARDKKHKDNQKDKHKNDAAHGWYKYSSRFALPVFNEEEAIDRYNVFGAEMIIRHSQDNKLYLYDIINIKKETSKPLRP